MSITLLTSPAVAVAVASWLWLVLLTEYPDRGSAFTPACFSALSFQSKRIRRNTTDFNNVLACLRIVHPSPPVPAPNCPCNFPPTNKIELAAQIRAWALEFGFRQLGIADIELAQHEAYLQKWLEAGYRQHGLHGKPWQQARPAQRTGARHLPG